VQLLNKKQNKKRTTNIFLFGLNIVIIQCHFSLSIVLLLT